MTNDKQQQPRKKILPGGDEAPNEIEPIPKDAPPKQPEEIPEQKPSYEEPTPGQKPNKQ